MRTGAPGHAGIEMTADPAFARRIRRMLVVSIVALGAIRSLAARTLDAPPLVDGALLAGWISMPVLLGWSLRNPWMRYLLALPSTLVGAGLIGICLTALPNDGLPRAGWLSITVGVLLGGALGAWFWYRWLPVPRSLDDPFAPGRWALISLHVTAIAAGLLLVALAQLR